MMTARSLFKLDAAFEAVLAAVLVVGGATGSLAFPHPVGRAAVTAAGAALGLFALALAVAATRASHARLLGLALVNDATACAAVVWLVAARPFSASGGTLVVVAVLGLLALSSVQLRAALRRAE